MKSVSYLRPRAKFRRVLRVADLDRLGVDHQGEDLVFETENRFTIVMSNKASDSLVAALPNEFRAYPVDGDDEEPAVEVQSPLTSLTHPNESEGPEGSEDQSEASAADDVTSSTRTRRRNG